MCLPSIDRQGYSSLQSYRFRAANWLPMIGKPDLSRMPLYPRA